MILAGMPIFFLAQVELGDRRKSSFEVEEHYGSFISVEADAHSRLLNRDNIGEHGAAFNKPFL